MIYDQPAIQPPLWFTPMALTYLNDIGPKVRQCMLLHHKKSAIARRTLKVDLMCSPGLELPQNANMIELYGKFLENDKPQSIVRGDLLV